MMILCEKVQVGKSHQNIHAPSGLREYEIYCHKKVLHIFFPNQNSDRLTCGGRFPRFGSLAHQSSKVGSEMFLAI